MSMNKARGYLVVFAGFYALLVQLDAIEIGFGQPSDAIVEGEARALPIRLRGPSIPVSVNITGYVKPYTYAEYQNININRTITSTAVLAAIDGIQNKDTPESFDLNFDKVYFTITDTTAANTINMQSIIFIDNIHEAEEHFILVMNITKTNIDIRFDDEGGVIVYTILDNNPISLVLSINSQTNFSESHGLLEGIISVVRENYNTVPSEVDLPVNVTISSGSAIVGEGVFIETPHTLTYTIRKNDPGIVIAPIIIANDDVPETTEFFQISISESGAEGLNIFPSDDIIVITIEDDDVAKVVFTQSVYTVTEGDEAYVEVCITLDNGVTLSSSSAYVTFNVSTLMGSAVEDEDYLPIPDPISATLKRGMDRACSMITIINDDIIEETSNFTVSLTELSNTFSRGVTVVQDTATVLIIDDDGYLQSTRIIDISSSTQIQNYSPQTSVGISLSHPSNPRSTSQSTAPNYSPQTTTSSMPKQGLEITTYASIALGILLFVILHTIIIISIVFWCLWSQNRTDKSKVSEIHSYDLNATNSAEVIRNITYNSAYGVVGGDGERQTPPMEINDNSAYGVMSNHLTEATHDLHQNDGEGQTPMELNENSAYGVMSNQELKEQGMSENISYGQSLQQTNIDDAIAAEENYTQQDGDAVVADNVYEYMN